MAYYCLNSLKSCEFDINGGVSTILSGEQLCYVPLTPNEADTSFISLNFKP